MEIFLTIVYGLSVLICGFRAIYSVEKEGSYEVVEALWVAAICLFPVLNTYVAYLIATEDE